MKRERRPRARFAVCIKNKGYEASLEIGKLYRIISDKVAEEHGYLRIVDESGNDYGYAADRFFAIDVPQTPGESPTQGGVLTTDRRTTRASGSGLALRWLPGVAG